MSVVVPSFDEHEAVRGLLLSLVDDVAVLTDRVAALEAGPPPPEPAPVPSDGAARVRETFGIRTAEGDINVSFQAFIDELGRIPAFYRWTMATQSYTTMSSNAWAIFTDTKEPHGHCHKFPTVTGSIILPLICGKDLTVAERNTWLGMTAGGSLDAWWQSSIWDRVAQAPPGMQHRFCLASEPELSWAHSFRDVDIGLWKAAYNHVAAMVHDAGHLVVYAGDGPFMHPNPTPAAAGGVEWWEYGLPDVFDIFGCDLYWGGETWDPDISLNRFDKAQQIAEYLGKPVCFPEYGVERTGTHVASRTDQETIDWFTAVWDLMEIFPDSGPGSLDHHCVWHTAKAGTGDWRLTPSVMDVLVERFGR